MKCIFRLIVATALCCCHVFLSGTATAITGGRDAQMGYVNIAAGAGGATINLSGAALFEYQLERNSFSANNKGVIFSLVATGAAAGDDALGSITFQEIT